MRLPFLKPKSDAGGAARPVPGADDPSALQQARTRARRRLMGAVVLLVAAVVGFPLLFETQPRPLPNKSGSSGPALVIKGDDSPPAAAPVAPVTPTVAAAAPAPAPVASSPERLAQAPAAVASAATPHSPSPAMPAAVPAAVPTAKASPAAAASAAVARTPAKAASATKPAPTPTPAPAPTPAPTTAAAAQPPAAETAASAPGSAAAVRWVVQVGAYNDMERMRAARQKVERLGFKTYITDVDTPTGKRTRVRAGPFATKKEAEDAAIKLKAAGMAANVLSI